MSTPVRSTSDALLDNGSRPQTPSHARAFSGDDTCSGLSTLTYSSFSDPSLPPGSIESKYLRLGELVGLGKGATRDILASPADKHKVEALWPVAQKHLQVFQMEHYASFNTPDWVSCVLGETAEQPLYKANSFTVRKLIEAMFTTAEDLGLEEGKRYVAAAVCGCAIEAANLDEDEDKNEALAKVLQGLASTWVAYLLWPFYANEDSGIGTLNERSGDATPPESDDIDSIMDELLRQENRRRSDDLRDLILQRDGFKCVLTGCFDATVPQKQVPEGVYIDDLHVCHILKRSVAAYLGGGKGEGEGWKSRFHSASATFDILRQYCQLDTKYIDTPELMHTPLNAFPLTAHFRRGWDNFCWCLHPKAVANCYVMKVYNRLVVHTDRHGIPPDYELKFKDQSHEIPLNASGRRLHIAASVDLPDPNLLRLHAALAGVFHLTNVVCIFRLIEKRSREPGSPPVPSADGEAFMKSIVEPEGDQLWQSVAMMWCHCKRSKYSP